MLPPEALVLAEEEGCAPVVFGDATAGLRAAGLLAPPRLWASLGSTGEAASADGAARAAAESTALARPWLRRSTSGMERRVMQLLQKRDSGWQVRHGVEAAQRSRTLIGIATIRLIGQWERQGWNRHGMTCFR